MTRQRSRAHSTNSSASAREDGDGITLQGILDLNAPFPNLSRRSRLSASKCGPFLSNKQQNQQNSAREQARKNLGLADHVFVMVHFYKRLVRSATETPLAQGHALERNLFLKICVSESALARMRCDDGKKITSPSSGFEV